jgi:hypothetical protein
MFIKQERPTINTKLIKEEPKSKHKVMFVRMPSPIAERFEHQKLRLSCSMNSLARMAIIKFLEEEEANERRMDMDIGSPSFPFFTKNK